MGPSLPESRAGFSPYHEEERSVDVLQGVYSIGGHRVHSDAPGQGEEPGLTDHVEVGGNVGLSVFPLKYKDAFASTKKQL